ncbi:MAG: glycosyltransferase family 4 protein [Proteobacteria bacterium]|nr:glycosyltransferase family 4 protein [Pseudomonadota bacterium]
MRVAVIGAFPFPYPQGSQVYAAAQARALIEVGARPTLITYARGEGDPPQGVPLLRARPAPSLLRSGFSWAKPAADAALLHTYLAEHRRLRFDVALAHNAEAAAVALAARPFTRVPTVYVVHTLWCDELQSYGPARWSSALDSAGGAIDRTLARRADAVIALSEETQRRLGAVARGPVVRLPPGLDPMPAPDPARGAEACARLGLRPGHFALYCGNLDPYQDLDLLAGAARISAVPIVAATHDRRGADALPGLRCVEVGCFEEMRTLAFAAGVLVAPRQRAGGFPVKLLNYMEAARPIVAVAGAAGGLGDDAEAVLLPAGADAGVLAAAVEALVRDPERSQRLGQAARGHLEKHHGTAELARRTVELLEQIC